MNQRTLIIAFVIIVVILLLADQIEFFSSSGLAISDDYCDRLTSTYLPHINDPKTLEYNRTRICGPQRREIIDHGTGNYYTENGVLV